MSHSAHSSYKTPAPYLPALSVGSSLAFGLAASVIILRVQALPTKFTIAMAVGVVFLVILIVALLFRRFSNWVLFLLVLSLALHFEYLIVGSREHVGITTGLAFGPLHILLSLLFVSRLCHRRPGRLHPTISVHLLTTPNLLFLSTAIIASFASNDKVLSFYAVPTFVTGFLLYYYFAYSLDSSEQLATLLVAFRLCLLITGLVCFVQVAIRHNFTLTLSSVPEDPYSSVFRATGLAASPNLTAAYVATLLPLTLSQVFESPGGRLKPSALAAVLAGLGALFLTGSRGAWLATAVGTLPILYLLHRGGHLKGRHIAAALFVLACLVGINRERILSRMDEGADNLLNRSNLNRTAASMIRAHPLWGIGPNTYTTQMEKFTPPDVAYDWTYMVHNKYLLVWSEMGSFALLFFLWSLAAAAILCARLFRAQDPLVSSTAIGVFSSLLVYFIHMNVESYSGGPVIYQLWLFMGMSGALAHISPPPLEHSIPGPPYPASKRMTLPNGISR